MASSQLPLTLQSGDCTQDFVVGYTFWILKDYKARAGYNFDSIGISTMGTVPWAYAWEFRDNAMNIGLDPHKAVYYAIQRAENPYTYVVKEQAD